MIVNNDFETVDLLGVGIGPFNMSLAALLSPHGEVTSKFFDGRESFVWHAGQLFPNAEIQVSYLKDLVTLADPTNPYSFLAYLKQSKRLYRFINARFNHVLRMEFNLYLDWVSKSLPNMVFGENVQDIKFKKSCFVMQTSKRVIRGKHLVLGNGLTANVPDFARPLLSDKTFHVKDFLVHAKQWKGKRVAIIGGGQSGAEIVQELLADSNELPSEIVWVTKRAQFAPIDDSVFANELFTPKYSEFFYGLPQEKKRELVEDQTLASDGVSMHLLDAIYQRLYVLECIEQRGKLVQFFSHHRLLDMTDSGSSRQLVLADEQTAAARLVDADIVILCTGYQWKFPSYLSGLSDKIALENGKFKVNQDFSIEWDGPDQNRIYVQNAARHSHGVADPNLSLMAWRSATIINSLMEKTVYDLSDESAALDWASTETVPLPSQMPMQKAACPSYPVVKQMPHHAEVSRFVTRM
jgi:lysine N6-hydroxylase